ncbi:hypothetical protein OnM2_084021 [Erysiphe neolycopersici]|uniref:Phosphoribosylaminoimidazole-succinocarboxamide synthase n=1 Tax=Erysiphe neolycopersici TaxID=212602 RepID=A0A420HEW4_9PEZI|nr:hypothetical protein OnM2_084021 [Erysiphe neolycopersici]
MNNKDTNVNDGNSSRYKLPRPRAESLPRASQVSWHEDDWFSSSSSVSNPTTVIRYNSPDKSSQHYSRSLSQPSIPIRKASLNQRKFKVQKSSIESLTSEIGRPKSDRNLFHYQQNEYNHRRQKYLLPQAHETPILLDDLTLDTPTWNSEESDLNISCSSNIDNTPFIRFAIEQLTRAEDLQLKSPGFLHLEPVSNVRIVKPSLPISEQEHTPRTRRRNNSNMSDRPGNYFGGNIISNQGNPYLTPEREREGMALTRKYRSPPSPVPSFSLYPTTQPEKTHHKIQPGSISLSLKKQNFTLLPIDVPSSDNKKTPPLTFVPWILKLPSIIIFSLMCILMIIVLIFCAIISARYHRINVGYGSVSGWQYFLMNFAMPIFAALVFLYLQSIISAIIRIIPFSTLASNGNTLSRSNAFFDRIYPKLLLPARVGNFPIDICLSTFWLSVLTIPLQSCLFSINVTESGRNWVTVQGVAWTLIIIYTVILIASLISGYLFFNRATGLLWDPRSLADIISLLPRSNAFQAFSGSDILKTKQNIRHMIGTRRWRLGYWKWQNRPAEIFYCLGQEEVDEEADSASTTVQSRRLRDHLSDLVQFQLMDVESGARWRDRGTRYRYISWYLRNGFVLLWPVLGFILWLILVILLFLPTSTIQKGFMPSIGVSINKFGFSSAQFLVKFGPSVIGMLMYLLFQSVDMRLRILKPWAELSKSDGSRADESLLLDYPAAPPIYVSLSAFSAGHYRISLISFLTTLFILLPIFSGSLFYPSTIIRTGEIKVLADMRTLIALIILLGLYIFGLSLFTCNPDGIYLPHDISCLAEIITFLYNSHILEDSAFFDVRSKVDLATRLMAERTNTGNVRGCVNRWAFGVYKGRDGKDSLGIERVGRNPGVGLMIMSAR